MKQINGWSRFTDRFRGFLSGLRKFRLDQLSDHSSLDYIDNIFRILRVEEAKLGTRQSAPKSPISNAASEATNSADIPVAGSESSVVESKKQLSA
jgi:triacylglycerol lipase